ncbi:FAD/NAD(P)-binding domain-containing protein [Backusella circina FSU 941]|nr:FAD/NAD(P)-binding domain-containing protein [Backusella circina FSU 941]
MITKNTSEIKNIVFIGGSSGSKGACVNWLADPIEGYRFIVIEERTHFNHVFAFPRASVISGFERELFIPYDNLFKGDDNVGKVVNARATAIHKNHVELDREVPEFGTTIDYKYLVYTAGTKIPAPGRLPITTKKEGIAMLKKYQELIKESERPIIIGAGAVGLELAGEIKEHYPEKEVTLIHSRSRYMPRYKVSMDVFTHNILKKRGVKQILGERVNLPEGGFPLEVKPIEVHTKKGRIIHGDLAITCIGMTPNSGLLQEFAPDCINKENGFVKVKPTMQIDDDNVTNIFAAGDVTDHSDVKTGHFAWMQGLACLTNIRKLIDGASQEELVPYKSRGVPVIKLYLGKDDAVLQTDQFGPLLVLGTWLAGRNISPNLFATFSWNILNKPYDEADLDE